MYQQIINREFCTSFDEQGKSKSLTWPKSSPVATALPACDTHAVFTSALLAFLGQIPTTSLPSTLTTPDRNVKSLTELQIRQHEWLRPGPRCEGEFIDLCGITDEFSGWHSEELVLVLSSAHLRASNKEHDRIWQLKAKCKCDHDVTRTRRWRLSLEKSSIITKLSIPLQQAARWSDAPFEIS